MNRFRIGIVAVAAWLLLPAHANAQEPARVTGTVTQETGAPVAGASVFVRSLNIGTVTREDGTYLLIVPASRIQQGRTLALTTQMVGFRSQTREIAVSAGATLTENFQLGLDVLELEAIVATGVLQIVRQRREDAKAGPAAPGAEAADRGPSMRIMNLVLGLLLLALGGYILVGAADFSEMGARFPLLVGYGFLVLAAILLAMNLAPKAAVVARSRPFAEVPWRIWGTVVGALVLFGFAVDVIGFYETAFLFVLFTSWLLAPEGLSQARRLAGAAVFAAPFTVAVYVAFRLVLEIPTPRGLII
jgi:hypothetical protein